MYHIYFVFLGCLIGITQAQYSQFYYQPNFYTPAFHSQPIYQPLTYNTIPQTFPAHFGYQPAPFRFLGVQANKNFNVQSRAQTQPEVNPQHEIRNEAAGNNVDDHFRGYAYHTELDHGARSNVVFLTGPEVNQFRATQRIAINPRTGASDAVDSNANNNQPESNPSIEALVRFLEHPRVGVQKFYSVNNALVAKNLEDDFNQFPASTMLIQQPISPLLPILRSRFSLDKPTEKTESKEEPIVQASEKESRTIEAESSTKEEVSSTTESVSKEVSSTTESAIKEEISSTTISSTTPEVSTTIKSTMAPIIVEDIKENETSTKKE